MLIEWKRRKSWFHFKFLHYHDDSLYVISSEVKWAREVVHLTTCAPSITQKGQMIIDHVIFFIRPPLTLLLAYVIVGDGVDEAVERLPRRLQPLIEALGIKPPHKRSEIGDIEGTYDLRELPGPFLASRRQCCGGSRGGSRRGRRTSPRASLGRGGSVGPSSSCFRWWAAPAAASPVFLTIRKRRRERKKKNKGGMGCRAVVPIILLEEESISVICFLKL